MEIKVTNDRVRPAKDPVAARIGVFKHTSDQQLSPAEVQRQQPLEQTPPKQKVWKVKQILQRLIEQLVLFKPPSSPTDSNDAKKPPKS